MNPWLSRAMEKLHFARLALAAAGQVDGAGQVAGRARQAMLEEAAVLHAWGGWMAMLNAIAVHLNLPAREDPTTRQLLAEADASGTYAEPLAEIRVLGEQPGSWLNRLQRRARATWNLRAREPATAPRNPGMIARSAGENASAADELAAMLSDFDDFLERHKNAMEEW